MSARRMELARLFRATGQAHHHAFAATNGEDPDWPEWYARYLSATLAHHLGRSLPHDALVVALRDVDRELRAQAPGADWTLYYADWFLARHAPTAEPVPPPA